MFVRCDTSQFAHQMLKCGVISDLTETNDFYEYVFETTKQFTSWKQYEAQYQQLYDKLENDFELLCNTITGIAENLLEDCCNLDNTMPIVKFLNMYCSGNDENISLVKNNSKWMSILNEDDRIIATEAIDYLFSNIFSLTKLFGISVCPIYCHTTGDGVLYECSLDVNFHRTENPTTLYKTKAIGQANGIVIEVKNGVYRLVCRPGSFLIDWREMEKKLSTVDLDDISATIFGITQENRKFNCFKKPFGYMVNMFHYNGDWLVSCPEMEIELWKNSPLLKKIPEWRDKFWNLWKSLDMGLPETEIDRTFMFVWNRERCVIIFVGSIGMSGKYDCLQSIASV